MEGSHKRKHSDGEASCLSLHVVSKKAPDTIDASLPTHQTNTGDAFGQRVSERTYTNLNFSGQARSHLGDSFTVNNYHGPPPSAEDLETNRHNTFMEALHFTV
jgi:hypothetical protein